MERREPMDSKEGAKTVGSFKDGEVVCGIKINRSPMFQIVTGDEKYKVVDLVTGGESYFDEVIPAYRMCSFLINVLRHNYRLEVRG